MIHYIASQNIPFANFAIFENTTSADLDDPVFCCVAAIVLSCCDKMATPNASPSSDPSNNVFGLSHSPWSATTDSTVYFPPASMFEAWFDWSPDANTVDTVSPKHLLAPTPPHAPPTSSVGSPATSMRSTPTAGQYPAASASSPSPEKKVCSVCKKTFYRLCDLNRHKKTHDRPFKCQVDGCEYQARGFPTDQERKRHVNDRHSDAPAFYSCTSEGCSYRSKRESNLKQHREKTHAWTYDRNRPKNGRRAGQPTGPAKDNGQSSFTKTSALPTPSTYLLQTPVQTPVLSQIGPPFAGNDFALSLDFPNATFLDRQHDSTSPLFMTGAHTPNHGVYTEQPNMGATTPVPVAWEEPATENQLSTFLLSTDSQPVLCPTTHHNQQGPHSWTPTNPELLSPACDLHAPVVRPTPNAIPASYLGLYPFAGPVAGMPFAAHPMVPGASLPMRQAVSAGGTSQVVGPHNTQSVSSSAALYRSGSSSSLLKLELDAHAGRVLKRGMGASSRDGHRRHNRDPSHLIPGTSIPFDENRMPCPFRITDPAYHSRGHHERFLPCHTEHRYISTLFRHLSRAAHNLVVDKNSASSFGVDVSPRPQPHAGLCRNCWDVFYDRDAFEQHTSHASQCRETPLSKREKYNIIRQTFCSPHHGSPVHGGGGIPLPPPPPSQPPSSPPGSASDPDKDSDDGSSSHGSLAPPEAASPVLPQATPQLYDNSRRLEAIMQLCLGWGQQSDKPADPDVDMEYGNDI